MKHSHSLMVLTAAWGLTSCAALTTYNKSVDLQERSISIDAKQRVVYTHKRTAVGSVGTTTDPAMISVICAEPSPDALSALAASGALTVDTKAGAGGSGSGGLAETAASIGLRTQSIQLLRDQNYRVCEMFANGALTAAEAAALMRRNQSTMLGLLAIEQLTGPVVASQVALTSAMTSGTGGPSGDVEAAESTLSVAKEKAAKAETDYDASVTARNKSLEAVTTANTELADAEKEDATDAVLKPLRLNVINAGESVKAAQMDVGEKQKRLDGIRDAVQAAEVALRIANRQQTGTTAFTGAQLTRIAELNQATTAGLTEGVGNIVQSINVSYYADNCFSLINSVFTQPDLFKNMDPARKTALSGTLDVCVAILSVNKDALVNSVKALTQ